jgi:hypothetical protein
MLPPRLKNHFMNLMHKFIKRRVRLVVFAQRFRPPTITSQTLTGSATKLWATMTELEQEDITRLSQDICSHPTLVRYYRVAVLILI